MHRLIAVAALLAGMPSDAQDRDYRMTYEIGPLAAEPMPSTGGDYELVGGIRAIPPAPNDRIFTDSFEAEPTVFITRES